MSNRTVQNRLKDLRAEGKSYAQIGRELGVSRSLVSKWAKGTRSPSKKKREAIYRRWRKQDKRLRNAGGVVDLSSYFRRLWYSNGVLNLPLNYRNIPPYSFPINAPVRLLIVFNAEYTDEGGFNNSEFVLEASISSNEDIGTIVEARFLEWFEKAQTSFLRVLKVMRSRIILQWMKI